MRAALIIALILALAAPTRAQEGPLSPELIHAMRKPAWLVAPVVDVDVAPQTATPSDGAKFTKGDGAFIAASGVYFWGYARDVRSTERVIDAGGFEANPANRDAFGHPRYGLNAVYTVAGYGALLTGYVLARKDHSRGFRWTMTAATFALGIIRGGVVASGNNKKARRLKGF